MTMLSLSNTKVRMKIITLYSDRDKCTPTECENVTAEALELSLNYNFVTPLTSMVVTKPETNTTSEDTLIADKLTEGMSEMARYNGILLQIIKHKPKKCYKRANSTLSIYTCICIH